MNDHARRWVVLAATLAAVALTARLGVWQLSRASQKIALQAAIETRAAQPAIAATALAREPAQLAGQLHRRVVLFGRWLPERSVFLDNRQMDGRTGFDLLTPLQLAPGDVVLVQRGWAPRDQRDRALLPAVPTPAGEVRIEGRIAAAPARLYDFAKGEHGVLRQNVDVEAYARETGLPLRPLTVLQLDDGAQPDGLLRRWPKPAVDVQRHYGYAFQWFALATLLSALYVWFQLLQPWLQRRRARR